MVISELSQDLDPVKRVGLIHQASPIPENPPISALPPIYLVQNILHNFFVDTSSHVEPAIPLVIGCSQALQREDLVNRRNVVGLLYAKHIHKI